MEIHGYERHQQQTDDQRDHVTGDRPQALIRMHPADGAGGVIADPEGRCEQPDAHGEDDDHRIMDFVDADLFRDRKQQRTEQHDGGNPSSTLPSTMNAAIETSRKLGMPPGRPVMAFARSRENPDCVSDHAMLVAAPIISRIEPDSAAVSTSIGKRRRQSNRR